MKRIAIIAGLLVLAATFGKAVADEEAIRFNYVAGCPNDENLMWCLHLRADAKIVRVDRDTWLAVRNAASVERQKRLEALDPKDRQ